MPTDALHLDVGPQGWMLAQGARALARHTAPAASAQALVQQVDDALNTLDAAEVPASSRLHVTLQGRWVRSFMVEPPHGVRCPAELRQCARARFEALFGEDGALWAIRAAWHPAHPFVATAVPTALPEALAGLCARRGWRLSALRAAWVRPLAARAWPRAPQWWALLGDGTATVLRTQRGRVVSVRAAILAAGTPAQARALLEREQLPVVGQPAWERAPVRWMALGPQGETEGTSPEELSGSATVPAPAVRRRGAGGCPSRRGLEQLDFARLDGPWSRPPLRRLWPAAVMVVAASVGWVAGWAQWRDAVQAAETARSRLARTAPRHTAVPSTTPAVPSVTQVEAWNAVALRLNTPWPAILHALEVATPADVALLSIAPDGQQARLRGAALARDHGVMFDYMRRLAATPPLADARLLRHDTEERDPPQALRFQFEVQFGAWGGQGVTP
jgi:hypothetical protein